MTDDKYSRNRIFKKQHDQKDSSPFAKYDSKHFSQVFYEEAAERGFKWAVRPYKPNFVTGVETPLLVCDTWDEIFKMEFIKNFEKSSNFLKFTDHEYGGIEQVILQHDRDGKHWVVAFIQDLDRVRMRKRAEKLHNDIKSFKYALEHSERPFDKEQIGKLLGDVMTYMYDKESY